MHETKARGLAVIVATAGRAAVARSLIEGLEHQTRRPDAVFVVGARPQDVGGAAALDPARLGFALDVRVGRTGSAHQRNDALALLGERFETIVFFDDDFVPSRLWLERAEAALRANPAVASLTGEVLADGIRGPGIPLDEAKARVAARDAQVHAEIHAQACAQAYARGGAAPAVAYGHKPYGCNMAFRWSAIRDLRFDERLPLYAWHEDVDFGARVARRGALARSSDLWGVHLGAKNGRTPGVRLGYSQIANSVYLVRKGTLTAAYVGDLMARNLLANIVKSLRPEPFVDRRGRLRGNLLALADVLRGRITPERAASL